MPDDDLCYLCATDALARFGAGTLSPVDLVEALIARTEAVGPRVNAFTYFRPEAALEAAAVAERAHRAGRARALEGIPLGVKDLHPVAGERTRRGSLLTPEVDDAETHPYVERLLAAGAIVFARTTSPEFGAAVITHSPRFGVTRNPWNPDCTPGGSGGGAGAALAAGLVTICDGSDYGGSIRVPASCCGVFGYKPPYGRNPSASSWPDPFSHYGPITRCVADAALMQNVTSGQHPKVLHSLADRIELPPEPEPVRGLRVALSPDLGFAAVDESVRNNLYAAAETFAALGCEVEEVALGWGEEVLEAFLAHSGPSFAHDMWEFSDAERGRLASYTHGVLEDVAARVSPRDFPRSMAVRDQMYGSLGPVLARADFLICPTTGVAAVAAEHDPRGAPLVIDGRAVGAELGWVLTYPFNMLGPLPVASVPSGFGASGVPTGMQIVGRPYDDATVFRAAADFERARPWMDAPERRPRL